MLKMTLRRYDTAMHHIITQAAVLIRMGLGCASEDGLGNGMKRQEGFDRILEYQGFRVLGF